MSATGRLVDTLAARFGSEEVFRDIETIEAGDDFRNALNAAVQSAQVMVVVIGRSWSGRRGSTSGSRLLEHDDYVRLEVESALAQDIPVIPVLVEGARMPAADDLPESLRPLAYRQALDVSDSRWRYDTERLVQHLARHGLVARTPAARPAWLDIRGLMSVFTQVPADFLRLLYEPRRLLTQRGSGAFEDILRGFVFLFVTQLLGALLVLQEWPTRSGLVEFMSTTAVLWLLVAFVVSLPTYWAWRIAGAGREYRRVIAIVLYQCSFVGFSVALATVVMLVGVELALPDSVDAVARNPTIDAAAAVVATLKTTPAAAPPWIVASFLAGGLWLGMLVWLAHTWEAYRLVLGQSRLRSWAALAILAAMVGAPAGLVIGAVLLVS